MSCNFTGSGCFYIEGNAFLDMSVLINSTIGCTQIQNSTISSSSIDMLNSAGNYQNITNVADPIVCHDAATKCYVDNLGVFFNTITLNNTFGTLITASTGTLMSTGSMLSGCFTVNIKNLVLNGPSAIFLMSKNEPNNCGHVQRSVQSISTPQTTLDMEWPPYSDPILFKTNTPYNGSYNIKIT